MKGTDPNIPSCFAKEGIVDSKGNEWPGGTASGLYWLDNSTSRTVKNDHANGAE